MNIAILSALSVALTGCFTVPPQTPHLESLEEQRELGQIASQDTIPQVVSIYNPGPGYLVIEEVRNSCGSRMLRWDSHPIAPGDSGTIELILLPGERTGVFHQTVVARTNAKEVFKTFRLSAEVVQAVVTR